MLASVHGGGKMLNVDPLAPPPQPPAPASSSAARSALDARTVSSFFRVYRASVLRAAFARHGDHLIQERGFACKAELLVKLERARRTVAEVPVDLDAARRDRQEQDAGAADDGGYGRLFARERLQRESAKA